MRSAVSRSPLPRTASAIRRKKRSRRCNRARCCSWKTCASIRARRRTTQAFADELASLGEIYVGDAFSAAHRAHASVVGLAERLPSAAGRLMQAEIEALTKALEHPERPVVAIVGGAKVSTKLELLGNLIDKVDALILGGGMANTFLAAQGTPVGKSLCEREMVATASDIMLRADAQGCDILLPIDARIAKEFRQGAPSTVVAIEQVPDDAMILDIGPVSEELFCDRLDRTRTVLWNGPLGAFEIPPFDSRHQRGRPACRRADGGRPHDEHRRRRRHHLRARPCQRPGRVLLRLHRRRRLLGVAGGQDPPRGGGVGARLVPKPRPDLSQSAFLRER